MLSIDFGCSVVGNTRLFGRALELVFIDASVVDADYLQSHLAYGVQSRLLGPGEGALAQIVRQLEGQRGLKRLHIFAHGAPGALHFGAETVALETLGRDAGLLTAIGTSLAADGEIYLWACNAGLGARGADFVAALSAATGARVVAARTLLGRGIWTLDDPAAVPPLSAAGRAGYAGVLATFFATTGNDNPSLTISTDTVVVTNTNQIQAADIFNGGSGNDAIQIGTAGAGITVDLSAASSNGSAGFLSFENLDFVNTSGTTSVTLRSAQFGSGKISNSVKITGTDFTNAIVINVTTDGSFDASSWNFQNTWNNADDSITITGSTDTENITGSDQNDTFVVSNANQVEAGDLYDGYKGTDTLQIGTVGVGIAVDLSVAHTGDSDDGFQSIEALTFVNTSGTSSATFRSDQFGKGWISTSLAVTGTGSFQALVLNLVEDDTLDLSGWTWTSWTSGTDTITITGSIEEETIIGSANDETYVVRSSADVESGDRYNAAGGTDTLQIGTGTAGLNIDLSSADTDGTNGFLNFEKIAYVNTTGTTTATFDADQFGAGRIADTVTIVGSTGTNAIVVDVDFNDTFSAAGWNFSSWTSGTDTVTIDGSNGNETLTGSSQIDLISGDGGADTLTGGGSLDVFGFSTGDTALTFGGSGTSGTVSGYDKITDFTIGASVATSEALRFTNVSVASNTAGTTGTASTLQLHTSAVVKSHSISNGLITFDDATTFAGAVTLNTAGDLAAVAQYLRFTDIGTTGSSVAFQVTLSGVNHTFVWIQGGTSASSNSVLVDVGNVSPSNLSANSNLLSLVDTVGPGAPSITSITENGGGGINAAEAADGTPVVVSLSGTGVIAGDTLTLNWGGQTITYTVLQADIDAGSVTVGVSAAKITAQGDGTFNVTATLTDSLGNVGAASTAVSVTVDRSAPGTPSITSISENGGGGINAAEASDGTPVVVSLSSTGAVAGDKLTIAWGGQSDDYTITGSDVTAGSATVTVPLATITAQGNGTFNVTAKLTDVVGNVGGTSSASSVTVDITAPTAPSISVAENAGGGINAAEASDGTPVVVSLSGTGAVAGDVVTVNWGGQTVTYTLLGADITAGNATVDVSQSKIAAQGDGTFNVTATITDSVGNASPASSAVSVTVDRSAPGTPSITSISENAGGGINAAEASDGTPVVVGLSGTGVVAGDTLTLNWDGEIVTHAVLQSEIDAGSATVTVSASKISAQGDGTFNVTAMLTDAVGNASNPSTAFPVTVDRTAPGTPAITSISENGGGGINAGEASDGTPVVVSLSGTGAAAGDTLTIAWGGETYDYTLQTADITAGSVSVTVPSATIAAEGDGAFNVTARLTDVAGNEGSASPAIGVIVDTVTPGTPAVSVAENGSGGINAAEATDGTPVVVDLTGTGAVEGDVATVNWGGQTVTYTLLGADITSGSATVNVTAAKITAQGDGTFNVTATITDAVGNTSGVASASVTVDTVAPGAPLIASIGESANGGINAAEASDGTDVVIDLTGTGAVAGDVVTLSWGGETVTYTLQGSDITAGNATVSVSAAKIAAEGDGTFGVTATITDTAGNTGAASPSVNVTVDTVAPGMPSVSVPENSVGGINAAEASDGTGVVVDLSNTGAAEGDVVTVGWGSQTVTYTLLASDITAGNATVTVSQAKIAAEGDGNVNVTAFITDVAGNVGPTTSEALVATVDTVAPTGTPAITSIPENSAGGITDLEASDGTPVVVDITGTNAVAGDTLTITWGGETFDYTLQAADISGNSATVTVPAATIAAQGDGTFDVTAKITDIAGNSGNVSSAVSVTVGNVLPGRPTITSIMENGSGGINAAEASNGTPVVVDIAGTNAIAGDKLTINWGGQSYEYTLVEADITANSATVTVPLATISAQGDGSFNVTASITNETATSDNSDNFAVTVDTTAPGAPSITSIVENGAGGINASEASDGTPVVVSLAGTGAVAGDTLTLSWGSQTTNYVLQAADISAGNATVNVTQATIAAQGDGTFNVSAKLTDIAGNVGPSSTNSPVTVDRVAPGTPSITSIVENGAGGINASEASDGTPVVVSLAGTNAVAGDTLTINWGGQTTNYVLQAADISAGSATVSVTQVTIAAQGDGTFNVTAKVTDIAGNAGPNSTNFPVTVDRVAPGTPSITSIVENGAGGINASEASDGTPVVVSLAGTSAVAGDTLTINWGGQTTSYVLQAADISAGSATVAVTQAIIAAQGDGTFNVSAKLTDIAGNVGPNSTNSPVTVDRVAPGAPSITSIVENGAGGINASEASDGTPVAVSLAGTNAVAGDTLTINWGGQTTTYVLQAADISAGSATVTVTQATIAAEGDGTFNVTAKLTDIAGNIGSPSNTVGATVDRGAPGTPSITSIVENTAGGINASEASDGTPVAVSLAGTNAVAGDTLTINWGGQTTTYVLQAADISAGSATVSVTQATIATQGDGTFNVTAKVTDIAGNVGPSSTNFPVTVDRVAPGAPSITSIVENGAGGINASEASDGTPVVVSLAGTSAVAGDTLTINWGGQTTSYVLQAADIGAGSATVTVTQSTIAAQGDGTFNVSANLTDIAGNVGPSSTFLPVTVDTVSPGEAPSITSIVENGAGGINASEASDGTPVVVSLAGTNAVAGDTLSINWGGQTTTYVLQAADISAGSATVSATQATIAAQGDGTFNVTAKVTDMAGNVGPSSTNFPVTVDTVAPGAPAISSIVENSGGGINAAEASNGTPVVVSLAGTGAVAGDTLTLNWGGQTVNYTLLASDINSAAATVTVSAATIAAQSDGTFNVSAHITDIAGNVGASSSIESATVDTAAPGTPAILSVPENSAGGINAAEASDGTSVVVGIGGTGAQAGDTLTLNWGSQIVTYALQATDILAGNATVAVSAATIGLQGDGTFNVSASITDGAGNAGPTSTAASVTVDTVAPGVPLIIAMPEAADGSVNAVEAADGTPVTVSLVGTGAVVGDTLSITWNGATIDYTLLASDIGAGSATVTVPAETIATQGDGIVNVSAKLTDIAGNVGGSSAFEATTVDTVAPDAPTIVSIPENGGGGINASEAANGTQVIVGLAGTGAEAGYTVVVNWRGQLVSYTLQGVDVSNGQVTVLVPPATIAAQGDGTFNVTASLSDSAGNASADSAPASVTVDTSVPSAAPEVIGVIEALDDGRIDGTEAADGTPVMIGLGGTGAAAGDTVEIQWGGQTVTYTLTAEDITNQTATVIIPAATIAAQGDGQVTVSTKLIDGAGNESPAAPSVTVTVDRSVMGSPTITSIVESADGSINAAEAADGTPVQVALTGTGAKAGDTLSLSWGGQSVAHTLDVAEIAAGSATVTVTAATIAVQGDGNFQVAAKIIAGGTEGPVSAGVAVTVDTTAPGAPTIASVAENAGGGVNAADAADGTPVVVGLGGTGAVAGNTLTLDWGGQTVTHTLLASEISAGSATIIVSAAMLAAQGDGAVNVTAKLTDAAGNVGTASPAFAVTVDTTAPGAPTILAVPENAGGSINAAEAADGTEVVVGLAGAGASAGDTLTLVWGGQTVAHTLSASEVAAGSATMLVSAATLAAQGDGTFGVTARIIDGVGNVGANAPSAEVTVATATVSVTQQLAGVVEGNSGLTAYNYTLSLDKAAASVQTIGWSVTGSGPHAANAVDFAGGVLPSGIVTFAVGETTKTVTLLVSGDGAVEFDETFAITLADPSTGLSLGTTAVTGTIFNDDKSAVSISALLASRPEGDAGTTAFTFTVSLDQAGLEGQTVNWSLAGSGFTPASAADFSGALSGTVSFAPGITSQVVTVLVAADSNIETDEGFDVTLSNASSGLTLGTAIASGTIQNDDFSVVSIAPVVARQAEGNSGTSSYVFNITLSRAAPTDVTINWSIVGSGLHSTDADDFGGAAPNGSVNFSAGETSKQISVTVFGDTDSEFDEAFTVTLASDSEGLDLSTAQAVGVIGNDDSANMSISAVTPSQLEGNSGPNLFTFLVVLDRPSIGGESVSWSLVGTGVNAANAADFAGSLPSGTVSFAVGTTVQTITVAVSGDTAIEANETFAVVLSNASAGIMVQVDSATATIVNDDASVSVAAVTASQAEGNAGTTSFAFTVTRSGDTSATQSVSYSVVGSGGNPASSADFGGVLPSGTVIFTAGETTKTIVIDISGDLGTEADETFTLNLANPSTGLTIGTGSASATITNDDSSVSITAQSVSQAEGNAGAAVFAFTVTRTGDLSQAQSVAYAGAGSGASPADAADFAGGVLPAGTVSFAAGEASKTILVEVAGDGTVEANEGFSVSLSAPTNGLVIGAGTASATILNDDATVSIAALAATAAEGNSGATTFTFELTLVGDSSVAHTVNYAVSGSGASPASAGDFVGGVLPAGTVSFAAGETTKTLVVHVAGDATVEPNEGFAVTLSGPSSGLAIATGSAAGTIQNDDSGGDPVLGAVSTNNDAYIVLEDGSLHVAVGNSVLFNDGGVRPLSAALVSGPSHGTLSFAADGSFDYTPTAGFTGSDSFIYRASGTTGDDEGLVTIHIAPTNTGATSTTLDLLSLSVEEQVGAVYTAFFGRGADGPGFQFWVNQFNSAQGQTPAQLFANIASSFGISDEAKTVYSFLADPFGASDGQISDFLDTVYENLFARSLDQGGLTYWTNEIKSHLANNEFVGSVLVQIINGAQNSAAGQDITTLMGKVTTSLEYVHNQAQLGSTWTFADDGAEAQTLLHSVTSDPNSVLVGMAQARALVVADITV